jgi:5-methyltetrahydrofolate--homocysteine methyltransferase
MDILEKITSGLTFFDGGTGTLLQELGLKPGEKPETWNITQPGIIRKLHEDYLAAGCDILTTASFGTNRLKFPDASGDFTVENLTAAAVRNARQAADGCGREAFVALDIGPTGRLLKPFGDLNFEEAVDIFAQVVRAGADKGADLILIETMNDSYETKAAVLAAKENADLPVFVTTVYDEKGKLLTGADPLAMVALLEGLGVDALGANCSLGPEQMKPVAEKLCAYASVPVVINPNAGMPRIAGGKTVYDVTPADFAVVMQEIAAGGARVLGGCCGTTPEHIRAMTAALRGTSAKPVKKKDISAVSSFCKAVVFGNEPVIIGERINPTGKKRVRQALREGDMSYVLQEAVAQQDSGAHILDVNVGLPELDEAETMARAVAGIQGVTELPLAIDTADPAAMVRAMRLYNGKPLINSVCGKKESMESVFPLVKKYGGVVIALTLDERGIPGTAEGRTAIAETILSGAAAYGIGPQDILFDPLTMAAGSGIGAGATLDAVRLLTARGYHTSLGVSNVSFGLPRRDLVNAAFFAMALESGLSAAIMNPGSEAMMGTYRAFCALRGMDPNCADYIAFASSLPAEDTARAVQTAASVQQSAGVGTADPLVYAIANGLAARAASAAAEALETLEPIAVIDGKIVPALNQVGRGYENGRVFLPQLLMSAEAAQSAFEVIREKMEASGAKSVEKGRIVLATVRGDIHDIGKNIVKVMLENYGFQVTDLGRDVPPERSRRRRLHPAPVLSGFPP